MDTYRAHALEGASGVDLTIALYDGIIRFMGNAIDAVDKNDVERRRAAVKRALDIIIHLQATLDKDIGGEPANALESFYVAMFALILQGSQCNSRRKFEQVIANVLKVREAWKQVAASPEAGAINADGPAGINFVGAKDQPSADDRNRASWTA
jgi:flagellar protein FliS